jgi:hypothetical protein
MRSSLAAGLMGVGGIFVAFGLTILPIAIFTKTGAWRAQMPEMISVATTFLLVGGVMMVAGYLLNRVGRNSSDRATA